MSSKGNIYGCDMIVSKIRLLKYAIATCSNNYDSKYGCEMIFLK